MRLAIVANKDKPQVQPALDQWLPWIRNRATVVAVESNGSSALARIDADAVLVLGGDGSFLSVARALTGRSIPLMGVNFGRVGFLASFTPATFKENFEKLINRQLPISSRCMIDAHVLAGSSQVDVRDPASVAAKAKFHAYALNDVVITAGPPFHMVELDVDVDGEGAVRCIGDGVIVATASGSTAYNVSAGGPIISPRVEAFCITPICAQSLSFRPVVVAMRSTIVIAAAKINQGTTLFCDGQESTSLRAGDRVVIRRGDRDVLMVENPNVPQWRNLSEKLNWAVSPGNAG